MKTKTTRLVDPQGRVSIPGYLRELAGINPGGEKKKSRKQNGSREGAFFPFLHRKNPGAFQHRGFRERVWKEER